MFSLIATLITIALIAIPIAVVVSLIRRMGQFTDRLRDPSRLQRVFAEHAASALRRAGADSEALAKLEGLGRDPSKIETDLRVAAYEARIGLQRKGRYAVKAPAPEPVTPAAVAPDPPRVLADLGRVAPLRRPARPRPRPAQSPTLGLDLGESFRLSEPPEINEPHGPFAISNWLALALFAGAAAWYFLR